MSDDALFFHVLSYAEVDKPSQASYSILKLQFIFAFFVMFLSYFIALVSPAAIGIQVLPAILFQSGHHLRSGFSPQKYTE